MDKIQTFLKFLSTKYNLRAHSGNSFWNLELNIGIKDREYSIKSLRNIEDVIIFSQKMSVTSKEMFCPYPWDDKIKLIPALEELLSNHHKQKHLCYLIYHEDNPVGLFYLWDFTKKKNLIIPELGEGLADSYHGKGLGGLSLDILTSIAKIEDCNAVELTTDLKNETAKNLYISRGYNKIGIIKNPLEVDQTKSFDELKTASKVREEYYFAKIFKNRENVFNYLKEKMKKQNELFSS